MAAHSSTYLRLITATLALALMIGCGPNRAAEPFVPDMDDLSYGGRRHTAVGTSASGKPVELAQFAGRFVWVDYAAPWCGPCLRQAPIIQRLEHVFGDKVVFLTVLTSDQKPGAPATRHTARVWAQRFRLDPEHVVFGGEWQRFIPQHGVFSPIGQTLFWKVGWLSETQVRQELQVLRQDWDRWYDENKNSTSVLLSEIGD